MLFMKRELIDKNPVLKLSFEFSLLIVAYTELLEQNKKFVIGKQLLRAGTSIGANAMEAQNAESKADFIHKMKIAAKEAEETQYWLLICEHSVNYPDCQSIITKLEEVSKVLSAILSTPKKSTQFSNL